VFFEVGGQQFEDGRFIVHDQNMLFHLRDLNGSTPSWQAGPP